MHQMFFVQFLFLFPCLYFSSFSPGCISKSSNNSRLLKRCLKTVEPHWPWKIERDSVSPDNQKLHFFQNNNFLITLIAQLPVSSVPRCRHYFLLRCTSLFGPRAEPPPCLAPALQHALFKQASLGRQPSRSQKWEASNSLRFVRMAHCNFSV